MRDLAQELPDFPWDTLAPYAAKARAHEGGIVDLSVGTPVDPTPAIIRDALAAAADAPGYPQTDGTVPSVPSILDPEVCGGSQDGLLAVYSLSKQSNLAGYRAAFVAGDVALVRRLLEVRKHAGLIVPWPVQRAMLAALRDDEHVA